MYPETLELSAKQIPYFRTPEFSQTVLECEKMLKEFAYAEDDARAVFLTSSGTGAMEATIINCFTPDDYVLAIDGGSFGHRFREMLELHNIPHESIILGPEEALTEKHLEPYKDLELTGLFVNIDESSTGQLFPLKMLGDFCKSKNMLLVVDAITSFLVDEFRMADNGVDAMICSSQKAFALAPGLSVVILSKRMLDRVEHIESGNMYFDFKEHLTNGVRGQTPWTPAVGVVLALHERLSAIKKAGLEETIQKAADLASDFRERCKELPVRLPEYPVSNAMTSLIFDDVDAYEVYTRLKEDYGWVITPTGGELAHKVARVGHMGNHTIDENKELVEKIKKVLASM
jgi:aspartate aminotransferase-like enzyme